MSTSLDLADPVTLISGLLKDNFSVIPVTVISGFTRGGYKEPHPRVLPVEGDLDDHGNFIARKKKTNLRGLSAKAEVYVYQVSDIPDYKTLDNNFADITCKCTIDIYHAESRDRFQALYNEIKRIIKQTCKSLGGNWSYWHRVQTLELSNRKAGFWRYAIEVELIRVSDFVGHV